jgi:hypothetical protein
MTVRIVALMMLLTISGCAPVPVGFDAPSELRRMDAVVEAAQTDDRSPETIRSIIEQLDSFDPAMRMISIRTLERFTGQTLGYDYAAPSWERGLAVDRWVEWYTQTYSPDTAATQAGFDAGEDR